jgi:hypothetical protein
MLTYGSENWALKKSDRSYSATAEMTIFDEYLDTALMVRYTAAWYEELLI